VVTMLRRRKEIVDDDIDVDVEVSENHEEVQ
jgi:hypothetical protein